MTTPPNRRGFLIMPFDTRFDWLRDDIIAASRSVDVAIERADDIFAPGVLLDQVLDAIDQAAVVVGICTGKNANVFFELGYAWRSHGPVLLAESTADLPFDVAHYRILIYGTPTPALDREQLRTSLARMMRRRWRRGRFPEVLAYRAHLPSSPRRGCQLTFRKPGEAATA